MSHLTLARRERGILAGRFQSTRERFASTGEPVLHDTTQSEFGGGNSEMSLAQFPSFTLNSGAVLNRGPVDYILRAYWEPLFFFATNAQGQTQTFRNDLVGVGFEANLRDHPNGVKAALSFGWIAHSEGNYFNSKPVFRLSAFEWQHGPFHIGPAMYFDHFFKDVTPSIRFSFLGF